MLFESWVLKLYIVVFTLLISLLAFLTMHSYKKGWSKHLDLSIKFDGGAVFSRSGRLVPDPVAEPA